MSWKAEEGGRVRSARGVGSSSAGSNGTNGMTIFAARRMMIFSIIYYTIE